MVTLGVVLAGGKSQRMGQNKAELIWKDGKTLTQHAQHTLQQSGLKQVVISGAVPGGTPDRISGLGPLSALETIIHKHQPERILLIPVDMPLITRGLIKRLLARAPKTKARLFANHTLPLLLPITPEIKRQIRKLMEQSDAKKRSIRALLSAIETSELHASELDQQLLINANTPEQWAELTQINKGS